MDFTKITGNSGTTVKLIFLIVLLYCHIFYHTFEKSKPKIEQYLCYTHSVKEGLFQGNGQLAEADGREGNAPARDSEGQMGHNALSHSTTCSAVHRL